MVKVFSVFAKIPTEAQENMILKNAKFWKIQKT